MAALPTDKLRKGFYGSATTLSASINNSTGTIPLSSTVGLPTDTAIDVVIDRVDGNGNKTPSIQETMTVVISGTNGTLAVRGVEGSAQSHSSGAVVEVLYTAATHNDVVNWGLAQHNQDGSHSAVTASSLTVSGAGTLNSLIVNGSWDGWVGANEAWAFASATTITVPSDATTKYDLGDYVKFTQSATLKVFVVVGVASTVLTLAGLAGVTVANTAISANAYSKVRTPHANGLNGAAPFNPCKFSVWLNTDTTITNQTLKVPFDTKEFDTGSNFDIVTNHRFTTLTAMSLQVSLQVTVGSAGMSSTENATAQLYKNGSFYLTSQTQNGSGNSNLIVRPQINKLVPLNANDYLEVFVIMVGSRDITNGQGATFFSGYEVSAI